MPNRANNFDTLRFCAALAVLWSHAFGLSMGREGVQVGSFDPIASLSGGQMTMGDIAVATFFVISGYLVTQSFVRSRSIWRFVKARILRVMPGFLLVLALLGLVVGPLVTTSPLSEYFLSRDLYRYLLNATLLDFYDRLPGVFEDNPRPYVNGPLWTLRFEVECYLVVFVLGILGLLNRYVTSAIFLGGLAYLAFDGPYVLAELRQQNRHINLGTQFLAGAVIYHWRPRLDGTVALICAGVTMLALLFGGLWLVVPTFFAYVVIYLALGPIRLPNMARYGDLSYGIYIYAWPVKQLILLYSLASTWYWLAVIATPTVIAMSLLSWHLVEKIALSHKDYTLPTERRLSEHLDRTVEVYRSAVFQLLQSMVSHSLRSPNSSSSPRVLQKPRSPGPQA
jgi:peptidoglycan/LPS O-acetylase OafA/YrhL